MNYFPFHIGDYAAHTRNLSPLEDIAYRRMLDAYYLAEAPLLGAAAEIAREIGMREHLPEVEYVLAKFFVATESGFRHERCDAEIAKYQDKLAKSSAAGRASAERRLNARSTSVEKKATPVEKMATDVQPTNNQEPITNNHNQSPRVRETQEPPEHPPRSMNFETFEPTTRAGAIAILLRDGGIQINSMQPVVQAWANRPEVTDEILVQAALTAKQAKPGERIGSAYLAPIVEQLLKPRAMDSPAAKYPAWRTDDREADKLGRELGVKPATMETYDVYRSRIAKALRELREKEAA